MIYFDNAATTKPSNLALESALKFNTELYYNPSALYIPGINVSNELDKARLNILHNYVGVSRIAVCSFLRGR